jgi:imidazolonepropionase-like amidohydrolase/predicted enzyme related to lactoylglutathione lyase
MKKMTFIFLTFAMLLGLAGCSAKKPQTIVIKNVRVIVGNGQVLPSATVVLKDGRIETIATEAVNISNAQVIDGTGKSLMPGIIDSHLHIFYSFDQGEAAYRSLLENQVPVQMKNFLKYGVTTIKSMDDPLNIVLELRQQLQDKKIQGPRLLVVGPNFTAPDGHPALTLTANDPWLRKEMVVEVDNPEAAREKVRELASKKVDAIKLIYQGGEMETFDKPVVVQKLSKDVMQAIIDEAHKQNLRATVHVWYEQDAIDALEAGADGIEHGLINASLTSDRLPQLLNEKKAFFVPTLQILQSSTDKQKLPVSMKNLKELSDAGVSIAMGTDMNSSFQTGGSAEIEEMELMQQAGMTPNQVIVAATSNAAQHLGLSKDLGTVEAGKIADLILLDGDPTRDVSEVRKIVYVFQSGSIVYDSQKDKSETKGKNVVTWFDIPVNDIDRAKTFYEKVLDIKLIAMNFGDVKFAAFPDKGDAGGAAGWLIQNQNSKPSGQGTVVYFEVDDMDMAVSRIQAAGGEILQLKFKMGQLGYVCLFQDSEGNIVGLRSSK